MDVAKLKSPMKIFISWSGTRSQNIAKALRDWLPDLFNGIETFVSSEDIRRGKRWPIEVSKELESSNFGIVCLTNDNLQEPWILFESGALSKSLKDSMLFTLLVGGLKPSDVDGPLSHFQHTLFEKENFFGLVKTIDEAQGALKREEARLRKNFERSWPELEENINKALKSATPPRKGRTVEQMLEEILGVVTSLAKNTPALPDLVEEIQKQYGVSLWNEPARRKQVLAESIKVARATVMFELLTAHLLKNNPSVGKKFQNGSIRPVFDLDQKTLSLCFREAKRLEEFNNDLPVIYQALHNINLSEYHVWLKPESEAP
jgi:hypothetical protein